jgi:hypothetical protein
VIFIVQAIVDAVAGLYELVAVVLFQAFGDFIR